MECNVEINSADVDIISLTHRLFTYLLTYLLTYLQSSRDYLVTVVRLQGVVL